jgi:hypothetical protein
MSDVRRLRYAVVRYHYDRVRDQAINVGVLLQTDTGLRLKTVNDWQQLRRVYPFLDARLVQEQTAALASVVEGDVVSLFDYDKGARIEMHPNDPSLLPLLNRTSPESIALTEPRVAELTPEVERSEDDLLHHLFETFVEPPLPLREDVDSERIPTTRRAHLTLRRAAVRSIVRSAKQAGIPRERLELDPTVKGRTREWKFDVRIATRASRLLQHILVLPDLEETYHEAAALARIWQDVRPARASSAPGLTAVFYSENGVNKSKLAAGERLLEDDGIETVYAKELPHFYKELAGQTRLIPSKS